MKEGRGEKGGLVTDTFVLASVSTHACDHMFIMQGSNNSLNIKAKENYHAFKNSK